MIARMGRGRNAGRISPVDTPADVRVTGALPPLRSPPHRARQEDHHYYEPVRLPARQRSPPLTPSRRLRRIPLPAPARGRAAYPGWPSAVPRGRRRPGSRHLYAGHHLASNPGNRQAHPGDLCAPRFRCHLNSNDASTVNAPPGDHRHRALSAQRLPGPRLTPQRMPFPRTLTTTGFS